MLPEGLELLLQPTIFLLLSMIVGALIGSFLTMLVHRLPRMMERNWRAECHQYLQIETDKEKEERAENLAFPGSHCPHCKHPLHWTDNIPILGYLINRGRCRYCGEPIHWRYLFLELLSVAVAITAAVQFGPGLNAMAAMGFGWTLLALLFIDLEHQLLPDELTLPLLWSGLLLNQFSLFAPPAEALWGAVAGFLSLWIIFHLHRLLSGRSGMGRGDFKLFAALGGWCGWTVLPQILLIASVSAMIIALPLLLVSRQPDSRTLMTTAIPFGPFLAIGGWVTLFWGDLLSPYFMALMGTAG